MRLWMSEFQYLGVINVVCELMGIFWTMHLYLYIVFFLLQALQALDRAGTGFIDVRDFRRILDNFCFKMSNKQFKHFRGKLGVNKDNSMDYTFFLQSFKDVDPDVRQVYLSGLSDISLLCQFPECSFLYKVNLMWMLGPFSKSVVTHDYLCSFIMWPQMHSIDINWYHALMVW